jgi:hypothetical protein
MKSVAATVAIVAALSCSNSAMAQDGTYVGANFVSVSYKEDGVPTAKPTVLSLKYGKELNRNFAVEGRAGFGIGDDTVTFMGVPVDLEVDHYFGVYAKGILPLSDAFSAYGLVGFTSGKITGTAFGVSVSDSDSDVSFGFGADLSVAKNAAINLEWAKLFEGTGYKVESMSIGFAYKF